MSDLVVLAPVAFIGAIAAVVGLYLKFTDRGEMTVSFDISDIQGKRLQQEATRLGVKPSDLARAALAELLAKPDEDFHKSLETVLQKNRELYKRLA